MKPEQQTQPQQQPQPTDDLPPEKGESKPNPKPIPQAYLKEDKYVQTYYEAQKQARLFFLPFNEYERISGNKIRDDLPPNMPRVNDGSLAALLMDTPMRILAQPFTGDVKIMESIDPESGEPTIPQPWLREVMNILWNREMIPYANTQAPFFQKQQLALYRALIYGSCPIYTFFTNRNGKRTADMTIPYIRDVYLEVGKSSDLDSDYIMLDQYYTTLQLEKIIAAGNRVEATGVKSPWKIAELTKIKDSHVETQKEYLAKNPSERNRPVRSTQIKFTTIFQRGVGAPFDTFYMQGEKDSMTIVKSKVNEDPTGDLPLHMLYAWEDLFNPYGKGQVEVSGGTQNVLDYLTQLHVLANQLGLQPPILIEGDRSTTDLDSMMFAPSQFWFTGGAKVDMMETSSSIIKEFPAAYAMYKNQLVSMQGSSLTDMPSNAGEPTMGKTPAAINKQTQKENSHDTFLLSQCIQTFSRVFKSMLNIKMANMQGSDIIQLEADDAARLMRVGLIERDDATGKPQTNELAIQWDKLRGKFDFSIDPESSLVKNNAEQVAKLIEITQLIAENPYLIEYIQQTGNQLNLGEVYANIFTKLGLQDIEKILTPMSAEEMGNQPPPMAFDKPKIDMKYPDLPPAAQIQLLAHVGLNVSMMDVLMGPVLDPNIRGVYKPQTEPGPVMNPVTDDDNSASTQEQIPNSPQDTSYDLPKGSSLVPSPFTKPAVEPVQPTQQPTEQPSKDTGQPNNMDPKTIAIIQSVMKEKGVNAQVAQGLIHARAYGIPEKEIQAWLDKNNKGA